MVEKKLGNDSFVSNAPQAVVEKEKGKLAQAKESKKTLETALERVGSLS